MATALPLGASADVWAFLLAANVEDLGDVALTVRNPRAGDVGTMTSADMPGNLHACGRI